ncbi:hypothetical protein M378DRAFT_164303 [Amanita muscaria Koide BX008]|uniref:Uncharacterized protein n=1 Tax=Amanita muscaria (strain Koide BX008) TaxID=946122 RepID=A0A0C2X352_AMAMK|nr:hypothetical protein M378DRAFT_164303 [Amanita muscaria Koide BX008]
MTRLGRCSRKKQVDFINLDRDQGFGLSSTSFTSERYWFIGWDGIGCYLMLSCLEGLKKLSSLLFQLIVAIGHLKDTKS